uniref:DnaJ-like protein 60 n=1 Tax=Diabrotica virgifera virgifera TaxID=50390 RepID=A0A6P7F0C5_DIAVI
MYSFSSILNKQKTYPILNIIYSLSNCPKSHYDVLNLPRTCTPKEIKESFIKLSKENHPDLNKDKDAHSKFLAINESYKVLSNVESRRHYDLGLIPNRTEVYQTGPQVYNRGKENNQWTDNTFYANRDRNKDDMYMQKPYYGIKGQERVSNFKVVVICLALASFIVGLQFLAIAKSATFQREDLQRKSQEAQDSLNSLKRKVEINGNQLQIELLNLKFAEQERRSGRKNL